MRIRSSTGPLPRPSTRSAPCHSWVAKKEVGGEMEWVGGGWVDSLVDVVLFFIGLDCFGLMCFLLGLE